MSETRKFEEHVDRFEELVLYISQKCANDPKFNTIKLNKLLFFSDFLSYAVNGEPITGFEYQKLEMGPAPRRIREIRDRMVAEKTLGLQELTLQAMRRTVNLRRPNLQVFKAEQVALVDSLIQMLEGMDGDAVSAMSHEMPCWILPNLGETIPYETVFLSEEPPTNADLERGRAVAAGLGLLEHQPA